MKLEQRKSQILDAAITALARRGIAGATTRQIARAAGVKEPIVYRAFGSKPKLVVACLEEAARRVVESIRPMIRSKEVPELIRRYSTIFKRCAAEHWLLYHAVTASDDPAIRAAVRWTFRLYARELEAVLGRSHQDLAWLLICAAHFHTVRRRCGLPEADVVERALLGLFR
jgi:AcrR family transcriptional regulator